MHPVGPHNAQTYWARRIVVAVVALAVVGGVVWAVVGRGSGSGPSGAASVTTPTTQAKLTGVLASDTAVVHSAATDSTGSTGTSPTTDTGGSTATGTPTTTPTSSTAATTTATSGTAASTSPTKAAATGATTGQSPTAVTVTVTQHATPTTKAAPTTTAPKTTAPPKPSYDASGRLICSTANVTLTGTVWNAVSGQQPRFAVNATNTSTSACQFNTVGAAPVYTVVTSAGAHVWSTADCFPSGAYPLTTLHPGQKTSEVVVWAGTTSAPGCTAPRVRVKPGKYTLEIRLGAFTSKPLPFTLQ